MRANIIWTTWRRGTLQGETATAKTTVAMMTEGLTALEAVAIEAVGMAGVADPIVMAIGGFKSSVGNCMRRQVYIRVLQL